MKGDELVYELEMKFDLKPKLPGGQLPLSKARGGGKLFQFPQACHRKKLVSNFFSLFQLPPIEFYRMEPVVSLIAE